MLQAKKCLYIIIHLAMLLDSQLLIAPTGKMISPPHQRLSPIPMPPGYHQHQFPSTEVPPSRPMTPGEQFGRIGVHERWTEERAGEPSEKDVKVRDNSISLSSTTNPKPIRGNLGIIRSEYVHVSANIKKYMHVFLLFSPAL